MKTNWVTKNISEFLTETLQSFIDFVADGINGLFVFAAEAGESGIVNDACAVATGIAITLVLLMTLKQIFSIYVMETDGDADANPLQLIMKASQAIALISCNAYVFNLLNRLANAFSDELLQGVDVQSIVPLVAEAAYMVTTGMVALPLFLMLLLILVIIMGIKAGIRGAELALMKILFPFFCVDLLSINREKWDSFAASYLVTFFGYTLQIFCVKIFITSFTGGKTLSSYAVSLAWMYMSIKTPEWLQKYTYTSGLRGVVGGGVRNAAMLFRFR